MKFNIYAGLGGSFGGADLVAENEEFKDQEEAELRAWEEACQIFDQYDGGCNWRDLDTIMEEDGCEEEDALQIWEDERENWLEYYAVPSEIDE